MNNIWKYVPCFFLASGLAGAEQYVLSTDFHVYQPATFKATLNGRPVALHRNADGSLDVTSYVKVGKNTLLVEWTPDKNKNSFSKSVLTLGAGTNGKWRTLYKREVGVGMSAGQATFVFMGQPSGGLKPGKVVAFGDFHTYQPAEFEVKLNGDVVASMNSDGNTDLTPFLKVGKNVVTVSFKPGANKNQFSSSVLTVGQQVGGKWNSVVKVAVGAVDKHAGSVTFPIYR